MSNETMRRAWDAAVLAAERRSYIQGRVGRLNPDGTVSVTVPDRPNHLHVRVGAEGEMGATIAKNTGVPKRAGLPIRMRIENGMLVIVGVDHSDGRLDAFLGGDASGSYSTPPHTHSIGSGLEYEIEALRLEPGRIQWANGLSVSLEPYFYLHNGESNYFPGAILDLTTYQPAGDGEWAWVLVGVDPATNTAVAAASAAQGVSVPLTANQIPNIAFSGYTPLGAVRVRFDDTTLNRIDRYIDVRGWLNTGINPNDNTSFVEVTASEALAAGDFINVWNDSSVAKARKADASNGRIAHGYVLEAVSSAATATVYFAGINDALGAFLPGATLYLASGGSASASPPETSGSVVQELGAVLAAGQFVFDPKMPIYLT